ncbi:bifunctional ADP-dependent NAD(P)H-hydrate dehydratase/NAD(P)H-hydrate epimerase [Rarobacter faecitabidus]|uniref:Bifunctional NAD(P)H-hydrate repair enzyme n=1 Tax=Rarobacter faecitabidus TaxID=13243 RepID=A0A542ZXG6_RARFA|nr:bifunctional ADP-dependent NAD(P)H-hydrate dehydratase/NAD(P)H-hydrate epimerase [Rarobacter faecitabidus]TQL65051.1 hydroxyethylthiazole kinase-like uncharacterized protein yjeF [Rarobacter faecitabidus]
MIEGYLAADVREAERPYLDAGVPLMERAAFGLAMVALRELRQRRGTTAGAHAVILAGKGNNGADAMLAGIHLRRRGVAVTALLVHESGVESTVTALRNAGARVLSLSQALADCTTGMPWPGIADEVGDSHTPLDWLVGRIHMSDLIVDGILGTGTRPGGSSGAGMPDELAELLMRIGGGWLPRRSVEERRPLVIAVDLPSGIDPDTGTVVDRNTVLFADVTVTFQCSKAGLLLAPAAEFVGRIEVIDIGIGEALHGVAPAVARFEPADERLRVYVKAPGWGDHKYTRGVVGVVAGSSQYPGAGLMATASAVRAGAGMARYLGPANVAELIVSQSPEVVHAPGRVQAYVVGSGLPSRDEGQPADIGEQLDRAAAAIEVALGIPTEDGLSLLGLPEGPARKVPVVVDAGGFSVLPDARVRLTSDVVLTPHAGELAGLVSSFGPDEVSREQIEAEPAKYARLAHDLTGATVVLKGPVTVIADEHRLWSQTGPSWLARAGSGDILAGIIGSLLAQSDDRQSRAEIAAAGVLVHATAARIASGQRDDPAAVGRPPTAQAIIDAVPYAIGRIIAASSS